MLHLTYYAWVALPSAEEAKTPAILLDSVLDRETLPAGWRARSRQDICPALVDQESMGSDHHRQDAGFMDNTLALPKNLDDISNMSEVHRY
jgi:hypothetical protein